MGVIDRAMAWALTTAESSEHGYDQKDRWGPDYDCSSFVISAWEAAGTGVKAAGATYTGNMRSAFLSCGFEDVLDEVNRYTGDGLCTGDVLLNTQNHTAIYIGGGQLVHARCNETGGIVGGQTGDQTGGEICVSTYYNYPWDAILRYTEGGCEFGCEGYLPAISAGRRGVIVQALQALLIFRGRSLPKYGVDGDFGMETKAALQAFQVLHHQSPNGICGTETWAALFGG